MSATRANSDETRVVSVPAAASRPAAAEAAPGAAEAIGPAAEGFAASAAV